MTTEPHSPLMHDIISSLEDFKAEEIVAISLIGKSSVADYLVIASGRSSRQVSSMAEGVARRLREAKKSVLGVEGLQQGDWVLIDAGEIIIHLFKPDIRSLYRLESMWGLEEQEAESTMDSLSDLHRAAS
ncbi:MAG: ribosome silencing factor [Candidatus Pacebacteria bacterium]|nr:ribosome silencing factor [Candidatus Paceibacterota bacterium]